MNLSVTFRILESNLQVLTILITIPMTNPLVYKIFFFVFQKKKNNNEKIRDDSIFLIFLHITQDNL